MKVMRSATFGNCGRNVSSVPSHGCRVCNGDGELPAVIQRFGAKRIIDVHGVDRVDTHQRQVR